LSAQRRPAEREGETHRLEIRIPFKKTVAQKGGPELDHAFPVGAIGASAGGLEA